MNSDELKKKLDESQAECAQLRQENARLKAMLKQLGLKPAAKLEGVEKKSEKIPQKPTLHKMTSKPDKHQRGTPYREDIIAKRVNLFRSLFKGREDVYALHWQNQKGRSGYSPACANEWEPLLCTKPCSKCGNAKYLPLTNDVIKRHLLGEITVGLYPLLKDEKCWFLAADFDKAGWQEDASAFLQTCANMKIPAYLERSRSGKGGHVWLFFEEAVSSHIARKLGAAILTRTMETHHLIGFDSYDRFFPNQDTMPKGGFGNLIALPLQGKPRDNGNSVFINKDMKPFDKQWTFLGEVERLSIKQIEGIVDDASRQGGILGVRMPAMEEEADNDPWTLPPSRKRKEKAIEGPLPESLTIIRANMLFLEKAGLSPYLMNRLIRLAAFQNPEFYAAQAMRLSTYGKPRIISCAEEFSKHLALPRGCLDELCAFLESHKIAVIIEDKRVEGEKIELYFQGELTAEQKKIVDKISPYDQGVLSAPTGFGKTVLAAWMIAQRKTNTLILVHRNTLLEQWREQLAMFLGIPVNDIGTIGGGRKRVTGCIDIAMLQSLHRKGEVNDLIGEYGHIIVDECHHISAFSFEQVLREAKAKYILGLTATPIRKDGHHPIIFMQCGPIRERIHPNSAAAKRPFHHVLVPRPTTFLLQTTEEKPAIHDIYAQLIQDDTRNRLIVEDVLHVLQEGRQCLVLTERVAHLELLVELLQDKVERCIPLHGGLAKKQRNAALEELRRHTNAPVCIIATGRYIGEGFDYAPLDTLSLAMPISWRGTLQQYLGRLHRHHINKHEVRVYDYIDHNVPILNRMYAKRLRGYKALGYTTEHQMLLPKITE